MQKVISTTYHCCYWCCCCYCCCWTLATWLDMTWIELRIAGLLVDTCKKCWIGTWEDLLFTLSQLTFWIDWLTTCRDVAVVVVAVVVAAVVVVVVDLEQDKALLGFDGFDRSKFFYVQKSQIYLFFSEKNLQLVSTKI